jgi:hypothetical protein
MIKIEEYNLLLRKKVNVIVNIIPDYNVHNRLYSELSRNRFTWYDDEPKDFTVIDLVITNDNIDYELNKVSYLLFDEGFGKIIIDIINKLNLEDLNHYTQVTKINRFSYHIGKGSLYSISGLSTYSKLLIVVYAHLYNKTNVILLIHDLKSLLSFNYISVVIDSFKELQTFNTIIINEEYINMREARIQLGRDNINCVVELLDGKPYYNYIEYL